MMGIQYFCCFVFGKFSYLAEVFVCFCENSLLTLTLSPTALGPTGPRVFKGIQLKA
jgi:hypothetical protein